MMTQDCSFFFAFEDLALSLPYTDGSDSLFQTNNLREAPDHVKLIDVSGFIQAPVALEEEIHLDITARYKANDGNRTRVACAASACFI